MTSTQPVSPALAALAEECGVATGYVDGQGVWHDASAETLRAVLAAMGIVTGTGAGGTASGATGGAGGDDDEATVASGGSVPAGTVGASATDATAATEATGVDAADRAALERVRLRPWRRVLPPTVVAREGWSPRVRVHVPDGASLRVEVLPEDGGPARRVDQLDLWVEPRDVDGLRTGCATVEIPGDLPPGWHRIVAVVDGLDPRAAAHGNAPTGADAGSSAPTDTGPVRTSRHPDEGTAADPGSAVATLLVSPRSIPVPAGLEGRPAVGVAAQLYQVRSDQSWGIGDLSDLADLADWSGRDLGADFVLVNPMHAAEPYTPLEPSPYLPTTRRFASPLYLRPEEVPEYAYLPAADRARVEELSAAARRANAADTIDRDAAWTAKLEALRIIAGVPLTGRRAARFAAFLADEGEGLRRYATWCAIAAEHGPHWSVWPKDLREPESPAVARFAESHADEVRLHEWLQWVVSEQRADAQRDALAAGMRLGVLHDLAVGVHPSGADAWALDRSLARGVSVGAPPDMYNQRGQDWSQPPLRPDALAEEGYTPFRDLVRAALRDAGGVRIDHILGLFRLWWVPAGRPPTEGTYVRYDHEAMLGVLALEASRAGAVVVGEDLGTVAPGVREEMTERGLFGTSVLWFEQTSDGTVLPPEDYRRMCMASVTTHDLPPTAGYVDLAHVDIRDELGQLVDPVDVERRRAGEEIEKFTGVLRDRGLLDSRSPTPAAEDVTVALHELLSAAPSLLISVSVADLVGDRRPVNMPGTYREYPNWCVPLSDSGGALVPLEHLRSSALARRVMDAASGRSAEPPRVDAP